MASSNIMPEEPTKEITMRRVLIVLAGIAALAATASTASARDGCGRGLYWNGYRCAPQFVAPPRYMAPRYEYAPPRAYYGRQQRCQYGWTVQDGVCKPYRGY